MSPPSRRPRPRKDRFRILSVDGGGIRGLIPALVLVELERRVREESGEELALSDCFHLFAGTSTGGLIALGLTVPNRKRPPRPRLTAEDLVRLYRDEGPRIFARSVWQRIRTLGGWVGPKYSIDALKQVTEERFGDARLRRALRELVVTSYDMRNREPHFFKRWRAAQSADRNPTMVEAALATSAAPTYFPSVALGDRALVDGGVFAANPTVAAVAEALKRESAAPSQLTSRDLLVVSLGTGMRETGFEQRHVSRWGKVGWIKPRGGELPLLGAMLDGQSDAADHWAHMILNHEPGDPFPRPDEIGVSGPRYFRLQRRLPESLEMDDASPRAIAAMEAVAAELISDRDAQLTEIARRLARAGPIPRDPA